MSAYNLLDQNYVAEQVPRIYEEYQQANFNYEYGYGMEEFLQVHSKPIWLTWKNEWWEALPQEQRRELLTDRLQHASEQVRALTEALKELK